MKEPREKLTSTEAINRYFGSLQELNRQSVPFTCSCGDNFYLQKKNDWKSKKYIMTIADVFKHIRKSHRIHVTKPN